MAGSHETPFKMKGSGHYGLGNASPAKAKSSPAKDDPHTTVAATSTTEGHAAHENKEDFSYEESLSKQDPKTLTHEQKRVLSKYPGRKDNAEKRGE